MFIEGKWGWLRAMFVGHTMLASLALHSLTKLFKHVGLILEP